MKLLTNEILDRLPKLGATENDKDPILHAKLIEPSTLRNWYPSEFDGENYMFGLIECAISGLSWCHFRLLELEEECNPPELSVQRDPDFQPTPASRIIKGRLVHPYLGDLKKAKADRQGRENTDAKSVRLAELIKSLTAPSPVTLADNGLLRVPLETGVVFEINEQTYDHFFNAPMRFFSGDLFCFAESSVPLTMFFSRDGQYLSRQLTEAETQDFCLLANIPLP